MESIANIVRTHEQSRKEAKAFFTKKLTTLLQEQRIPGMELMCRGSIYQISTFGFQGDQVYVHFYVVAGGDTHPNVVQMTNEEWNAI